MQTMKCICIALRKYFGLSIITYAMRRILHSHRPSEVGLRSCFKLAWSSFSKRDLSIIQLYLSPSLPFYCFSVVIS